ncbi:hypothetical protein SCHPADRAFT_687638 [Schizopora paradoxa]|uniref:BTB domain-containing protein n=1 Tax=Schizopora paradoxa TaxID=27342 RepID=A0A0H2R428_9AGAM|nr:hypothetical protein SCHPADRAFT_687638 [Schizopora paradoxa]
MAAARGEFHPDFSTDGDVVLESSDGIRFRLDSAVLKAASTVFRDMFAFPRDPNEAADAPIVLTEDAIVLAFIFHCVFPTASQPDLQTYDDVWTVLKTAEKYDMPCVVKILRLTILSEEKFRSKSLNLFALASYCDWHDVARSSSNDSLKEDISRSENLSILKMAKTADAFALLDLHWKRKEIMKDIVRGGENFAYEQVDGFGTYAYVCKHCQNYMPCAEGFKDSTTAVEVFRSRVREYIDRCPLAPELVDSNYWRSTVGGITNLTCTCDSEFFDNEGVAHRISLETRNGNLPSAVM